MGEMRASLPGLQQLIGLQGRQVAYVDAVKAHVDGQAGDFGAFTGIMSLFADAYRDAHDTVSTSLGQAGDVAVEVRRAIRLVREDFEDTDRAVGVQFDRFTLQVESGDAYDGPTPGGSDGVPGSIKYGGGVLSTVATVTDEMDDILGTTTVDQGIRGLPSDAIDVVSSTTDVIQSGPAASDAAKDIDRYEEFANRHREREEGR